MSVPELSRRQLLALGAGAFVVAAVPFAVGRSRKRLVRRQVPVMGTIADLAVVHDDPRAAHTAIDAALASLRLVDRTMTRFSDDSDVGRANLVARGDVVEIDPHTRTVLEASLRWAESTDGAFDPCLGHASKVWEVTRRTTPPAADEIAPLAGRGLYRSLDLDTHAGRPVVRLTDAGAAIDLGGIAKGYGVDLAVGALRAHGVHNALVNVGGDLYAMGTSEDDDAWRIGIRSPVDPEALLAKISLRDEAVATSGDYERFFRHAGRRYHHLLDPRTAAPRATDLHSVSVKASTCMEADAAATAAFGMPAARTRVVLGRMAPGATIVSG